MANDTTVLGLTLAKINGTFHVDVKDSRWSVKRANTQHATGGGVKQSIGMDMSSGSFGEVIPRDHAFDWHALKNFSVEIYDKETQSIVIAAFEGCNWNGIDGSSDLGQANTGKNISWNGSTVVKI